MALSLSRLGDRITQALGLLLDKGLMPTDLSTAELETIDAQIRMGVFFSARTTNAQYLEELKKLAERYQKGGFGNDLAQLRIEARALLAKFGYDPARGFPGDAELGIPPAEPGSLRDLGSEARLNLILKTQRDLAAGLGQKLRGLERVDAFPAWELVREEWRRVPRGSDETSVGWAQRFAQAGMEPAIDGAEGERRLVAHKLDPGWAVLGSRSLFRDALDTDHPPFAFQSGMGWREVDAAEWAELTRMRDGESPELRGQGEAAAGAAAGAPPSVEELEPMTKAKMLEVLDGLPRDARLSVGELRKAMQESSPDMARSPARKPAVVKVPRPKAGAGPFMEPERPSKEEAAMINLESERGRAWDAEGNLLPEVLEAAPGRPDALRVPEHWQRKGFVMTHNHPSGASFSHADVRMAARAGWREMRAVGAQSRGRVWLHRMGPRRELSGEEARRLTARHAELQREGMARREALVRAGEISRAEMEREEAHLVMTELANEFAELWFYERIPL